MRYVKVLFLAAILMGLPFTGGTAHADPEFVDGPPDEGLHTFCYYDVSTLQSYMDAAMTRLREQTSIDTAFYNPCDEHTDVRWVQGPIESPPGFITYGYTECKLRWANGDCDRFRVTLYKNAMDQAPNPAAQYRKTACHELGHSVGNSHFSGTDYPGNDTGPSCMRSGNVNGEAWNVLYGTHHKNNHMYH